MATLIGGIAASHTPTIGFAFDRDKRDDPVWAPIFAAFAPIAGWLAEKQPDVLVFIYNDHVTSFFFDHYSAFALGTGQRWAVADEGGGARDLPPIAGDPAFAAHLGRSLMADEFDLSFFQERALDHGCFSPLSMLYPHDGESWPVKLVPLQVGVLQFPIPTARRCFRLGQALRQAIESYPENLKVAIVATGGLSHQVHGERAGFNDTAWDARFLDLFEHEPQQLTTLTHAQYAERGGMEGTEVVMWLVMRGALARRVNCLHRSYYLPSMAGIATAIYEDAEAPADAAPTHADHQLAGIDKLPGTYPFTIERGVAAYRINRFLHDLVIPDRRAAFLADEEGEFERAQLDTIERDLIRRRDWQALIRHGAIFFVLEKLGAVVGVSNLHIYAAMRGESLEAFQRTRNTKALYSVAGTAAGTASWEQGDTSS